MFLSSTREAAAVDGNGTDMMDCCCKWPGFDLLLLLYLAHWKGTLSTDDPTTFENCRNRTRTRRKKEKRIETKAGMECIIVHRRREVLSAYCLITANDIALLFTRVAATDGSGTGSLLRLNRHLIYYYYYTSPTRKFLHWLHFWLSIAWPCRMCDCRSKYRPIVGLLAGTGGDRWRT